MIFGDSALPLSNALPSVASAESGDTGHAAGLCALVAMIVREIASAATDEQQRGFFAAVGARLADTVPLDGVDDIPALVARLNPLWRSMGLGTATISTGKNGLIVAHDGIVFAAAQEVAESWKAMLPALMEGAYDRWFRTMGSGPALGTIAFWNGQRLEIRHGR